MMLVGARGHFSAGHKLPQHAEVHGHSYEVWVYTDQPCDAEALQQQVNAACAALDHRMLNDLMDDPTMENIARAVAAKVPHWTLVRITRPLEGLACEYRRDAAAP